MKKTLSIFLAVLLFIYMLSGCGSDKAKKTTNKFNLPDSFSTLQDTVIAENENYRMSWDEQYKKVVLTDIKTGANWSTTPDSANDNGVDEFGFPIEAPPRVNSPILIRYINPKTKVTEQSLSYTQSIKMGNIDLTLIENGVRVTYYFEDEEISIPVDYVLRDSGMKMSVNPKLITENKNKLYSVSFAPYLCSVKNNEKDSYLFVPSGSGALIYPKSVSQVGTYYSESVYGRDYTMQLYDDISNSSNIKLPVYGVKNGNIGSAVIIESGAEHAEINGYIGAVDSGYSNIGTEFILRGTDQRKMVVYSITESMESIYSDSMVDGEVSIGVYPLVGESATYNGIAEIYRNYLKDIGLLPKESESENQLHLKFLGATLVKKSFLGVPYNSLYPLTSLDSAISILSEVREKTDSVISVELKGYGETGLDITKLAGNYKISNKLGNLKQLSDLSQICKNGNNDLYFDFDIASLSKSGNSWSLYNDIAKGPTGLKSYQYYYDLSIRSRDESKGKYAFLSRKLLLSSAEKLIKKIDKWDISGIGLDILSDVVYSDYCDKKYYAKGNIQQDVSEIVKLYKKNGYKVLSNDANLYAACLSDAITDVPLQSSRHDAFDVDIPFYQMVFKGHISMTSAPINTYVNSKEAVLRAIEGGCGLSYSLIANYDTNLVSSTYTQLHRSLYSDIKEEIYDTANNLKSFYDSIKGAEIESFGIISESLHKTVFSNGVVLYTNHSDNQIASDLGTIEAYGFVVKGAE